MSFFVFFFFNDPATTYIYTLSLHDALPIFRAIRDVHRAAAGMDVDAARGLRKEDVVGPDRRALAVRSEEHTSELQSLRHLVCRLLLEKKKNIKTSQLS